MTNGEVDLKGILGSMDSINSNVNLLDELKHDTADDNGLNNDKLLALWFRTQSDESDLSYLETSAFKDNKRMDKNSFSVDGAIYPDRYGMNKQSKKILFILKESHVTDGKTCVDEYDVRENHGESKKFWFRSEVDKYVKGEKCHHYVKKISHIVTAIYNSNKDSALINVSNNSSIWENIAYININKRGGFALTDKKSYTKYIIKYRNFINKQIDILDPDIVICCGNFGDIVQYILNDYSEKQRFPWKLTFQDRKYYEDKKNKRIYFDMYHPSGVIYEKLNNRIEYINRIINDLNL